MYFTDLDKILKKKVIKDKIKLTISISLITIALVLPSLSSRVYAQNQSNFLLTPKSELEILYERNQESKFQKEISLELTNNSERDITGSFQLELINSDEDNPFTISNPATSQTIAKDQKSDFTIQINQASEKKLKLRTYQIILYFIESNSDLEQDVSIQSPGIGIQLYIDVIQQTPPISKVNKQIREIESPIPFIRDGRYEVTISNPSNYIIRSTGLLQLASPEGKIVLERRFTDFDTTIQPGETLSEKFTYEQNSYKRIFNNALISHRLVSLNSPSQALDSQFIIERFIRIEYFILALTTLMIISFTLYKGFWLFKEQPKSHAE